MEETTNSVLDSKLANAAAALLKLEPLSGLDPNDQESLLLLVNKAHQITQAYELEIGTPDTLKSLALALNHLGQDFYKNDWAENILKDPSQSLDDRIEELFMYVRFQMMGPESVDFSTYSILTYKRLEPETPYTNKQIHIASQMALEITEDNGIDDLLNSFACVQFILLTEVNFMEEPEYAPIQDIFKNNDFNSTEKVQNSIHWIEKNIDFISDLRDSY